MTETQMATESELESLREQAAGKAEFRRALAVLMSRRGYPVAETMNVLGLSRTAIYRILQRYRQEGPEGIREPKRQGRPVIFGESFRRLLRETLESSPESHGYASRRWTLQLLSDHMLRTTGKKISLEHMRRLLIDLKR